jgi:dTDP-4-dehydrorhamnose reductase
MHIAIIGASGLVGANLVTECSKRGHTLLGTYYSSENTGELRQLDKTDEREVRSIIGDFDPDVVIDTAAFHNVDQCETEKDRAWQVNAEGTANVAAAAEAHTARYVYLSTDYVFPGDPKTAPYSEADPIKPCNYYAETKYAAEQAAKLASDVTILRTSVVYGLQRPNFVTWALGELEAHKEIDIVDDQTARPTYAPNLARAAIRAVEDDLDGLFHATGPTSSSRYKFTVKLAKAFNLDPDLVSPISTEELGQDAPRPLDSSLDSSRLYGILGWSFDSPRAAFERMASAR